MHSKKSEKLRANNSKPDLLEMSEQYHIIELHRQPYRNAQHRFCSKKSVTRRACLAWAAFPLRSVAEIARLFTERADAATGWWGNYFPVNKTGKQGNKAGFGTTAKIVLVVVKRDFLVSRRYTLHTAFFFFHLSSLIIELRFSVNSLI